MGFFSKLFTQAIFGKYIGGIFGQQIGHRNIGSILSQMLGKERGMSF